MEPKYQTFGKAALLIGVQDHQLERLVARGRVAVIRAGRLRLIAESDFPAIREECLKAGYLKPASAAV